MPVRLGDRPINGSSKFARTEFRGTRLLSVQPDRHPDHLLMHVDPGHPRMDGLHGQPPAPPDTEYECAIAQVFASFSAFPTRLSNTNTTDQGRAASTGPKSLDVTGVLGHPELCPALLEADKEGQDNG